MFARPRLLTKREFPFSYSNGMFRPPSSFISYSHHHSTIIHSSSSLLIAAIDITSTNVLLLLAKNSTMVKPLAFKGDKKVKKRKRTDPTDETALTTTGTSSSSAAAARVNVDEDDGWINAESIDDINGPVIFVFASTPPTCLACDANGKIFSSPLENIDGEDLSSAEPHDVRQVWVSTRIADTNRFAFKGHHSRYLSIDKFGILSATTEAISPEEEVTPIHQSDTTRLWALQTVRDKFVSAEEIPGKDVVIRGDSETIGFGENWGIRMQRRFKKKVKKEGEVVKDKISRKDLEKLAGKELNDDEVKKLKRARKDGSFQSALLDLRHKGKHDKHAY